MDPDIQTTVADVIKAIIAISANSNDQGVIGPNALSRNLVSEQAITSLVKNMIRPTESGSNASLTTGVSIVIELIRKNNSDYDLTPILALAYNNQIPTSRDPIYLGAMLRVFANTIGEFQALLLSPKNVRMIKTSGYGEIESLGFERFRICELYAELLHCSNMALLNDPRGEKVVRERDLERDRLKALAKAEGSAELRSSHRHRRSSEETETEKDTASTHGRRSMSSGRASNASQDEMDDAFLIDRDHLNPTTDSPSRKESPRRSSSEERRIKPEERRRSRGSMDEESRPYMPALPAHVIEGVPVMADEQLEEQKIIADIGPQTHPVPKPETAIQDGAQTIGSQATNHPESAVLSRTPSPPPSQSPLSPGSDNGAPLVREPPTTIEQDISTATQDNLIPLKDINKGRAPIDLNIDLENISRTPRIEVTSDDVELTPQAALPPSDHSDTLSISSTSSSQAHSEPFEPVIGDYLKMQFMNQHVISTILELFFKFPWNNFLHNVVYDVVQQVFNGPMDRGYNRVLAIDVFAQGQLCEKIVAGQKASDDHVNGDGVRLGYMGHLTLIAEEVVKFVERYPPQQISPLIVEKVTSPAWIDYVDNILSATRARDSAVLGGERPQVAVPQQPQLGGATAWDMAEHPYDADADDEELQRRLGEFTVGDEGETSDQFANYISQQISNDAPDKFGSSDEEDEDDDQELSDWMSGRGDFLRSRSFDRYENADDEQVESLDDTDIDHMPEEAHDSSELIVPRSPMLEQGPMSFVGGESMQRSFSGGLSIEQHEVMDERDRAPTPEVGPLPQSASPAPLRRSLDDEEEDDDDAVTGYK